MKLYDTICALSTPVGTGGISVIRVSGENAFNITSKIFKSKFDKDILTLKSHSAILGNIIDNNGFSIDEVVVTKFEGPNSFTGENVIEISCHGGMAVVKLIIKELISAGARIAENGEFTKRAFLNGKVDLSQAEAIIDIINANDEYNVYSGENHLKGILSDKINTIRNKLIDVVSSVIAVIDYPEEDIDEMKINDIISNLEDSLNDINNLKKTYNTGKIIKEGAKIVICGKPNVGKSSLLNSLLKENRAIVTDIAGTTRDTLEETLSIDGLKTRIIDTAGIRESDDVVESIGINKAVENINDADLILFLIDTSVPLSLEDISLSEKLIDKKVFVLLNKTDLDSNCDISKIKETLPLAEFISISAKNETGINNLTDKIKESILNGEVNIKEDIYITNERHFEKLVNSSEYLIKVINDLKTGIYPDIVTIDIENAISSLGEITGLTVSEEIIGNIFSKFCLGK